MKKIITLSILFILFGKIGAQVKPFCFKGLNSVYSPTTGISPNAECSADFNNDGKADLAVSNSTSCDVSILIGNGNGTFASAINYTVGSQPTDIISSDFNGDGKVDLVVVNYISDDVSVLIGNGNGTFLASVSYSVGDEPRAITANDFNGDGNIDLAVVNTVPYFGTAGSNVYVLLGTGTGVFSTPLLYKANSCPEGITSNDFNNDGKIDLAVVNWNSNDISILFGSGTGTFSAPIDYLLNSSATNALHATAIVSADFNGDSQLDLAVTVDALDSVTVLIGSSSGTFAVSGNYGVGKDPWAIEAGDFNGDGKCDLAVSNRSSNDVSVLMGIGMGSFAKNLDYAVEENPSSITKADFDGDGTLDLVTSNSGSNNLSILIGSAAGIFSAPINYATNSSPTSIFSKDINNDGTLDLITLNYGTISLFLGKPNGIFEAAVNYSTENTTSSVIIDDFNNDGKYDIAIANEDSNDVSVFLCSNSGTFAPKTDYAVGSRPFSVIAGDFNGDNNTDLAVPNQTSNNLSLLIGAGNGSFTSIGSFSVGTWPIMGLASDFNTDGNTDLAVLNSVSNNLTILMGLGNGNFAAAANYSVGTNPRGISTGDFNGDNNIDLVVTNFASQNVSVLIGSSSGTFATVVNYGVGTNPVSTILADINNDMKIDLITVNQGSNSISILKGSGTGTFNYTPSYTVGSFPKAASVFDINGDGKKDIITANYYSDNISFLAGVGSGSFSLVSSYKTGVYPHPNSLATGDFNNDGKIDVAVGNSSNDIIVLMNDTPIIPILGANSICMGNSSVIYALGATTYTWNTGATTSSITINPTGLTTYSLSGTTDVGCSYNSVKTISVSTISPTISIVGTNSICVGSSASYTATGASTYTWSSGAISSTLNVFPSASTIYNVVGTHSLGCINSQTVAVTVDNTCADVWPGDANSDGTADNLDVLELGLHYAQTGTPRASVSNAWQSCHADNWVGTITNGKNVNHSNCNGDGIINDDDTLAIYNNYGLTHAFKATETNSVNPQLTIVPDQSMVAKGNWGSSSIYLGDTSSPINNLNGVAFTAIFDNSLLETDSVYIEYQNSFIGLSTQNLKFRKPDFANGKIYAAITHTLSSNVSGYGKIATLHYKIKSNLAIDAPLNLSLTQANQSDASGVITPLSSGSASLMAIGASVGLNEISNSNLIAIQPNPSNGVVVISGTIEIEKIEILNLAGQVLVSETANSKTHQLNLENLANGVYFVKVYNSQKQVSIKKLVVQK